jgi:hypothetical protein
MCEGDVGFNPVKTDIVLPLILGPPGRTSEGFSPEEDRDKRIRSNTMSVLPGSRLCHVIPKIPAITITAYKGTVFERFHFLVLTGC